MASATLFPANKEKLQEMIALVCSKAEELGFEPKMIFKMELAAEEALVNVMLHAYPGKQGTLELECVPIADTGMKIVIKDQGVPFNPLKDSAKVDPFQPLEQRKVGGYGIFIILQTMDEVLYTREKDSNILTLVKYKIDKKESISQ